MKMFWLASLRQGYEQENDPHIVWRCEAGIGNGKNKTGLPAAMLDEISYRIHQRMCP